MAGGSLPTQAFEKPDLTAEFRGLLAGKVALTSSIDDLTRRYRTATPFPHLLLDDLFMDADLKALQSEMLGMRREQWMKVDSDARERTARMRSAAEMGAAGDRLLGIVHSAGFLYLLSEITGIPQLLPDPYLQGAGYAQMRRGDYFGVHADRNVAYETGLVRRLAMIIFLNEGWRREYHGQLELWTHDGKRCEVSIEPLFNRTVLFEVAYPNFHGVPTPLACPTERMRQSFITYYHTAAAAEKSPLKPHTSIFAPRFYGSNRLTLRSVLRDLTPPVLTRAIRKMRGAE